MRKGTTKHDFDVNDIGENIMSSMRTFDSCPFCGGIIRKKYSGLQDRLYTTNKIFQAYECATCKIALLNPMPTGDVSRYYPTNYLSGESSENTVEEATGFDLEKWYRYNQYRYDFGLLARATGLTLKKARSYLDIGSGSGERVTYAAEQGCKRSSGLDKFDFAKKQSKQNVELINSEVAQFKPKKKYKIVSLFHVLEHIEEPKEMLKHINRHILAQGGYLVVQVPNYNSLERKFFGRKWFSLDVPRHIWQFNSTALERLLMESGYKVEAAYQLNATLHPVTIIPSMFRELDIQRIWVSSKHGVLYKRLMTLVWAGLTTLAIPLNILQNLVNRSSMLTIVARNK